MKVYFSHSYRDVAINGYFLEHFLDDEISLLADQKTDIWCVAKLERYLGEFDGFVSVIPRRATEDASGAYSEYIGQELALARRARVPRLLFVDHEVFGHHRVQFPEDAVTFRPDALAADAPAHRNAIDVFRQKLETANRRVLDTRRGHVAVVVGQGERLRSAGEDVAELLRREAYYVTPLSGRRPGRGLEDIRLLENLRSAELCVFVLDNRLSDAYIALAMAHADFIPSIRLQWDRNETTCEPSVSGLIRWHDTEAMLVELGRQLTSYQAGLVLPVEHARETTATDAARAIGTMKWHVRDDNLWDVTDGGGLVQHVHADHGFVRDEVARAASQLKRPVGLIRGREPSLQLCRTLYDGLIRHRFAYEIEPASAVSGTQAIRTPSQIAAHRTATCIDVACLFASLLVAAGQDALVVIIDGPGFAHALAGYRVLGEPASDGQGIGDLRGAATLGEVVLFEATGAIESEEPVGAEAPGARVDKVLGFMDAMDAARRMVERPDVQLRHLVDVRRIAAIGGAPPQEG